MALVAINGEEERPLFAFPGVWTLHRGPSTKNGANVGQEVFAFMTTEPERARAKHQPRAHTSPDVGSADFETLFLQQVDCG